MHRYRRLLASTGTVVALLGGAGHVRAAEPSYGRLTTIVVPGNPLVEFDISALDPATETYFLADRSNAAVDLFDATNNEFLERIPGFTGYDPAVGTSTAGPNGLALVGNDEVWAGNGDSTVKVIDLDTAKIIDSISTGGKLRVDEMAYDPKDHVVVMSNNDDTPPFLTFVSTVPGDRRVLGRITFDDATNGLEATVYNPKTGYFYTSVPQVGSDVAHSAVAVSDPKTRKIVKMFPIEQCQPSGIALGPHEDLLLGCDIVPSMGSPTKTVIVDALDGSVRSIVRDIGGSDEVAYNPGDDDFYLAERDDDSGPMLGVISAKTNLFVAAVPTDANAHSVAVDPRNNHVFVPLTPNPADEACLTGCIGVYGRIPKP